MLKKASIIKLASCTDLMGNVFQLRLGKSCQINWKSLHFFYSV